MAQTMGGRDIPFSEDAIVGGRNFVNKLYNAARFLQMYLPEQPAPVKADRPAELADLWITERYADALRRSKAAMAEYDLPKAQDALYSFVWDEFCDWYLELAKPRLQGPDKDKVLAHALALFTGALKALHPFMPYVTEELYSSLKGYLPEPGGYLLNERWPEIPETGDKATAAMQELMGVITQLRVVRSQFEIPPGKLIKALAVAGDEAALERLKAGSGYVSLLAKVEGLEIGKGLPKPPRAVSAISGAFNLYVPMDGTVDLEKEKGRLAKELEKARKDSEQCLQRLGDKTFMDRAPKAEIEKIQARSEETSGKVSRLAAILEELK
jgi:valyl-tRNA synthetase